MRVKTITDWSWQIKVSHYGFKWFEITQTHLKYLKNTQINPYDLKLPSRLIIAKVIQMTTSSWLLGFRMFWCPICTGDYFPKGQKNVVLLVKVTGKVQRYNAVLLSILFLSLSSKLTPLDQPQARL